MAGGSPQLALAQQLDASCDQFESDFKAGKKTPRIEDSLKKVAESARPQLLLALIGLEFELRQKKGERPRPEEYAARFPKHADAIRQTLAPAQSILSSVKASVLETSAGADKAFSVDLPALQQLGRFQIRAVLGEGAFGTVYKAYDPQLDREVAIKIPRPGVLQKAEDRQRFLREARAAAGLQHANICPVYEVGTVDGHEYIVMAFIDGKSLAKVLQNNAGLTDKQIATVIRKIALALEEAHSKGVIHRDLKPANIMINRKGEPVIMDFGLARRSNSDDGLISQSGQIMGTPAYMSPEQARGDGKEVGPASDIYSLGVILYELLCGRRPHEGTVTEIIGQILHVDAQPPSAYRPGIPEGLQSICLKAISKRAKDRYESMRELAGVLVEHIRTGSSVQPKAAATIVQVRDDQVLHTQQLAKLMAAVSSGLEDRVERAAGRAVRQSQKSQRSQIPLWGYLAGSALMGLVILAGIFFFIRKDTVTVIVNIPIENINDPALSFLLDNQMITAEAFASPIELKPGEHELIVNKDGKVYKQFRFNVGKADNEPVVVQDVTPATPVANSEDGHDLKGVSDDGFVPLFNGKDLTGWQGNLKHWSVVNGAILGKLSNEPQESFSYLATTQPYRDFELKVVAKLVSGNSGIQIRSRVVDPDSFDMHGPQVEIAPNEGIIWGTLVTAPTHNPSAKARLNQVKQVLRPNEFNEMIIRCVGTRVTTSLNGVTVNDSDFIMPAEGLIGLQLHKGNPGMEVQFREVAIRPISPPVGERNGWLELFNGKDFTGWQGAVEDHEVVEGVIRSKPDRQGVLYTTREFDDFVVQLEFKLTPGANNGLAIRYPGTGDPAYDGMCEVQLIDPGHPQYGQTEARGRTGSAFAMAAATAEALRPAGEWNQQQVTVLGSAIRVELNGTLVLNTDLGKITEFAGNKPHPGQHRRQGYFGLFPINSVAEFRNIRIRLLSKAATAPPDARVFNGHSYKFLPEHVSWKQAKAKCEAHGGHLIVIDSAEENAFAAKLVAEAGWTDCWIGASDEAKEGQWKTVHGAPLPYANWFTRQNQPNNKTPGEHFALLSNKALQTGESIGWEWSDQPNEATQHKPGFICEWDEIVTTESVK